MRTEKALKPRWLKDYEVEKESAGVITARRLQKDRTGHQFFPVHKIGRSCYYDLAEINATIEKSRVGGKVGA